MAKPIELRPQPVVATEETERRLDKAKLEHAEAVLDAYRVLQSMHDTGSLDLLRGLLGAGDKVITEVTDVMTSPASTRSIRNLLILTNLLSAVDPDALHRVVNDVTPAVGQYRGATKPPSLFASLRRLFSKDSRRAIATGVAVLESVGRAVGSEYKEPESGG